MREDADFTYPLNGFVEVHASVVANREEIRKQNFILIDYNVQYTKEKTDVIDSKKDESVRVMCSTQHRLKFQIEKIGKYLHYMDRKELFLGRM